MIQWFEKHRGISWLITVLLAAAVFYVSSREFGYGGGGTGNYKAILYHLIAYFFFAAFLLISLVGGKRKKLFLPGIVLAIVYGISDELHQFFVPGRSMSLCDVFIDAVGVIFAAMIYFILVEIRR